VFHPLCYDNGKGFIEENEVNDYEKMIRIQINEFGQVPKQIFKEPHPKKFSNQIRDLNPFGNNDKESDDEDNNNKEDKNKLNDNDNNNNTIDNNSNNILENNKSNIQDEKENKIIESEKEIKSNFDEEKIFEEEKEEIETIINYPIYSKLKYSYNKSFIKISNFHKK
jgi:hypothetical protein